MATIRGLGEVTEPASRGGTTDRDSLLRTLIDGPIERLRTDADQFWKRIRRELLRHHRRLVVQATNENLDRPYEVVLRAERAELAEWWREAIAERAAALRIPRWHPDSWLSLRQLTPADAEAVAAAFVSADLAIPEKLRSLRALIGDAHGTLAKSARTETSADLEARLGALREEVDAAIASSIAATNEHVQTIVTRASQVLDVATQPSTADPDDPRTERAEKQRLDGLKTVGERVRHAAELVEAEHLALALRLELGILDAKFGEALDSGLVDRVQDVRGRIPLQLARVQSELADAVSAAEKQLASGENAAALASGLATAIEPLERTVEAARSAAEQLTEELSEDRALGPITDALAKVVQPLTEKYLVPPPKKEHPADKLPEGKPTALPFREIVGAHVEASVAPRLQDALRNTAARARLTGEKLAELARGLRFNLHLAQAELAVLRDATPPPETIELVRQVLVGFLERSRDSYVRLAQEASGWPDALAIEAKEAVLGGLPALGDQLSKGHLAQLRADQVRMQIAGAAQHLPGVITRSAAQVRRAAAKLFGERRLAAWADALGLPSGAPPTVERAALEPPAEPEHLPLAYRRVFGARAIDAGDVLVGRDEALARARAALAGEAPKSRALALIGPDGAGKNAVAAAAMRSRPWRAIHRIEARAALGVGDVDALFEKLGGDELVSISGLHWLVAMRPGGFAPVRRLVERIADDRGRNAFVVRSDELVWKYASEIAPLAEAFDAVVEVGALGPADLEAAVMSRHALTGFGADFGEEAKPDTRLDEIVSRGVGYLGGPRAAYFRELYAASAGMLRDALRLWLVSILEVDEKAAVVRLGPVPPSPMETVRRLDDEVLASLYVVARQGWMDADTLAWVLRIDRIAAAARLAQLGRMGVLDPLQRVWRITPHLRGPVHTVLRERGWT